MLLILMNIIKLFCMYVVNYGEYVCMLQIYNNELELFSMYVVGDDYFEDELYVI